MDISLVGLTLHVSDVERSLSFYRKFPDTTVLFHIPETFALLRIGTGRLGLLRDDKRAFHVEIDCDNLDATSTLLGEAGFAFDGPATRSWGERDIQLFDPDGNLVEFGQTREPMNR